MYRRISIVQSTKVIGIREAATFHIGDSIGYDPKFRGFSLNRITTSFQGNEGDFSESTFYEPIPKPVMTENVRMNKYDEFPFIRVGMVKIIGIANSSVYQIGSTKIINAEARVRHVRQFA